MRATLTAPVVAAAMTLMLGASVVAHGPVVQNDPLLPIDRVSGAMARDPVASLGDFSVDGAVLEFRSVPVTGAMLAMDDPRLAGELDSSWNYDILRSGDQPVPAWGTMRIEVPATTVPVPAGRGDVVPAVLPTRVDGGAWEGTFNAIRQADGQPFMVRAFLFGEGEFEGLCATLDIQAGAHTWTIDGVIHQVPMAG